jgi:hypothetical protein
VSLPSVFLFKNSADFRNPIPLHRLSAKLIKACACGVSATQLFGRSVAHLFISLKDYRKKLKGLTSLKHIRNETSLQFFQENIPVDFRDPLPFRRLSAKPPRRKRLWGLG